METCFQKLKLIAKKVSIIESVSISLVKSTYVLPVNSGRWKGSGGVHLSEKEVEWSAGRQECNNFLHISAN